MRLVIFKFVAKDLNLAPFNSVSTVSSEVVLLLCMIIAET